VISPASKFFDYGISVGAGATLLLICVRSGKRGQRLQDIVSGTMVVPRNWQPNVIDAYSAGANAKTRGNSSDLLFKFIYLSLWAPVLIVPAYVILYPTNLPPAKSNQTKAVTKNIEQQQPIDPSQTSMKNYSPLAGWLVGTCTNTTVGMTANLMLTIYGTPDAKVHGDLALFGDLGGGGAFQGLITSDHITFTTTVPAEQIVIEWQGAILGGHVNGTYVARCDHPGIDPALRHQEGVWSCNLVRNMGAPNPHEANTVWVYHDGNEDGPFTAEAFVQRLQAGQWQPNAILALNDRTIWSTAADYLAKLQADAAARN